MTVEKNIKTRLILNHGDWADYAGKVLKEGEVALIKVGTTQAAGQVSEPIWMMKIGDGTTTVQSLPWLVAPAADVYAWAKKASLDVADIPALEISKITGLQDALDALSAEDERLAGLIAGKADSTHNHDTVYSKLGHTHTASEITDFEDEVEEVVNGMGIATSDAVTALTTRVATAEGEIDALQEAVNTTIPATYVKVADYNSKVAELEEADSDLDTAVKAAQADATAAKEAIEAFLDDNAVSDDVVNTLKEINEQLASGETNAETLAADIQKNKTDIANEITARTEADETLQANIDKKADAGHNHDTVYSKLGHTHTVSEITDYEADVAAKIKVETDARTASEATLQANIDKKSDIGHTHTSANITDFESAVQGIIEDAGIASDETVSELSTTVDGILTQLSKLDETYATDAELAAQVSALNTAIDKKADQTSLDALAATVNTVKATADAAVKSVAVSDATGLKVTTTSGAVTIDLADDVVFELDCGTASDL